MHRNDQMNEKNDKMNKTLCKTRCVGLHRKHTYTTHNLSVAVIRAARVRPLPADKNHSHTATLH